MLRTPVLPAVDINLPRGRGALGGGWRGGLGVKSRPSRAAPPAGLCTDDAGVARVARTVDSPPLAEEARHRRDLSGAGRNHDRNWCGHRLRPPGSSPGHPDDPGTDRGLPAGLARRARRAQRAAATPEGHRRGRSGRRAQGQARGWRAWRELIGDSGSGRR